jgi:predicted nucleic acid-binding Zn ribbon protein
MPMKDCKCDDCGNAFTIKTHSEEEVTYCPFCSEELIEIIEDEIVEDYFYSDDEEVEQQDGY